MVLTMGPMQIKADMEELNARLYTAFGSDDTRTIDWGHCPPSGDYDIECEYLESEDELEEDPFYDRPYEGA